MTRLFQKSGWLSVLLVWVVSISGCVTSRQPAVVPVERPPAITENLKESSWWQIRFAFKWPENTAPAWHLDLMVAHSVVAPVLEKQREAIALWRFHRRAVRDAAGHQFSFILFTTANTAGDLFKSIEMAPEIVGLQASGRLVRLSMGRAGDRQGRHIEDTSDSRWSEELQKSWPWFIMGVSRMWLTLTDEQAKKLAFQAGAAPLGARIDFYEALNKKVSRVWEREGAHALLHHLNAIFGYEPLIIREERAIRF